MPAPSPAVEAFWRGFAEATGVDAPYEAWGFGSDDTPSSPRSSGCSCAMGPSARRPGCWRRTEPRASRSPSRGLQRHPRRYRRAALHHPHDPGRHQALRRRRRGPRGAGAVRTRMARARQPGSAMNPTTQSEAAGAVVWRAVEVPLAPGELDPSQVLAGRPAITGTVLSESRDGRVVRGIWRITEGAVPASSRMRCSSCWRAEPRSRCRGARPSASVRATSVCSSGAPARHRRCTRRYGRCSGSRCRPTERT